jgi:hypothetical protein
MRTVTVNASAMCCTRFSCPCPKFDRSLLADSYRGIGERIYGHPEKYYLDAEGRQWISEALIDSNIARYFLQNPTRYLAMLEYRAADFSVLKTKLREAHTLLTASSANQLARAIRLSSEAYVLALKYFHVAQPVVEHWCSELRSIVLRHLSRREANSYLTSILEAPAAAEAVKRGFTEDTGGSRRIDAVNSSPILIFAETIFPRAVVMDAQLHDRMLHSGDGLATFWSLRTLAPLAVQLAEECRYADYSLRTHLRYFLARARECNPRVNDPYEFEWRDLVALLEGDVAPQI